MKTTFISLILLLLPVFIAVAAPASSLDRARSFSSKGNHATAAIEYLKADSREDFLLSRYGLGLSLMRLKLPHLASIPMMTVATQGTGKLQKKGLDNLVKISFDTNDVTLLNYSINKLTIEDLEETSQEIYYNRLAEYYHENRKFDEALQLLESILRKNPDNEKALYLAGLIYLKKDQPDKAADFFKYLSTFWDKQAFNHETKGVALANYARALYQEKKLSEAESVYRQIPKDSALYRKVQMELAWTLFRAGKIRSALSTIHTLHTPYYENFYDPESFILRSLILLFACQEDEAMKVVKAFDKNFAGLDSAITSWIQRKPETSTVIGEIQTFQKMLKMSKFEKKGLLPFFVVRTLVDEYPLKGLLQARTEIQREQLLFQKVFRKDNTGRLAAYAKKAYAAKLRNMDKNIARVFNYKVAVFQEEFRDLESQVEFLKYEILEEKKRASKAKMRAGLEFNLADDEKRSFFVQNGYRYWPFNGEYWIDEIGNYQYLGVNRCEE